MNVTRRLARLEDARRHWLTLLCGYEACALLSKRRDRYWVPPLTHVAHYLRDRVPGGRWLVWALVLRFVAWLIHHLLYEVAEMVAADSPRIEGT